MFWYLGGSKTQILISPLINQPLETGHALSLQPPIPLPVPSPTEETPRGCPICRVIQAIERYVPNVRTPKG